MFIYVPSYVISILMIMFINSRRQVITTGADGDIRIWNGIDDDDPNTQCVAEFILYHVHYGKRILVSTDLNTVQAFNYPDFSRDGTEFRFTAPVTCIKVNDKVIIFGLRCCRADLKWLMLMVGSTVHSSMLRRHDYQSDRKRRWIMCRAV